MKFGTFIIFSIKFEKITCKCKICDIINVTKIINQNKNKNLRAKEDRMTFEFFDDETNYVSKRQVSQEVRARITAKLGKISSMIS